MKIQSLLLSAIALLSFTACQPIFEVSLCEGRPAYDLSHLAGIYKSGHVIESVKGVASTRQSDGQEPLVLEAKDGQLVTNDGQALRACRVEPYIWVEQVSEFHQGGALIDQSEHSFTLHVEGYSKSLLSQNKVPFEAFPNQLGFEQLLIRNKGVNAKKILESLDRDDYTAVTFLK